MKRSYFLLACACALLTGCKHTSSSPEIRLNQVGFRPLQEKTATIDVCTADAAVGRFGDRKYRKGLRLQEFCFFRQRIQTVIFLYAGRIQEKADHFPAESCQLLFGEAGRPPQSAADPGPDGIQTGVPEEKKEIEEINEMKISGKNFF